MICSIILIMKPVHEAAHTYAIWGHACSSVCSPVQLSVVAKTFMLPANQHLASMATS